MILQDRISLLKTLGNYILSDDIRWKEVRQKASLQNSWFIPEFVELATQNIAKKFLKEEELIKWSAHYKIQSVNARPQKIGIVMAGNIPLVGFHDLLAVFISGHKAVIKPSSKDEVLITELIEVLKASEPQIGNLIELAELLKDCDAYIATGSNNTSRYFEYYFGSTPTSFVAIKLLWLF